MRDADALRAATLRLANRLPESLKQRGWTLATAESCTGGLLGAAITAVPGSSTYYLGGVVSYANAAKAALLGVPPTLIERHGAVSPAVAAAMGAGARHRLHASAALSTTGIAGPGGGTATKPVGLVYIALATPDGVRIEEAWFAGNREVIRLAAVVAALELVLAPDGRGG
jgi:PncC family amidohydrolase